MMGIGPTPRQRYPSALDQMLPLADEAADVVAQWWRAETELRPEASASANDGSALNPDLLAVIGQSAFSALQRFAKALDLSNEEGLGDLSDLPMELISELSVVRAADELDQQILDIMGRGPMSIDQILVGLYRRTGGIHTRTFIQNKLYRAARKGVLKKFGTRQYMPGAVLPESAERSSDPTRGRRE